MVMLTLPLDTAAGKPRLRKKNGQSFPDQLKGIPGEICVCRVSTLVILVLLEMTGSSKMNGNVVCWEVGSVKMK